MTQGDQRREFADETPTPPMGMSWSGSLLTEGSGPVESERATGPVRLPDERADHRATPGPESEVRGPDAERAPAEQGAMGLAELLAAEDVGRAGPAVLGADPPVTRPVTRATGPRCSGGSARNRRTAVVRSAGCAAAGDRLSPRRRGRAPARPAALSARAARGGSARRHRRSPGPNRFPAAPRATGGPGTPRRPSSRPA